jgi:hypothetical protein
LWNLINYEPLGSAVLEAKNRRLLESASSKLCRDGIVALGYGITVDHISFEHEFSSGYVCRKCFVTIEKNQALKCQFIDVETDLQRFPFFVLGVLKVTKAWYVSL